MNIGSSLSWRQRALLFKVESHIKISCPTQAVKNTEPEFSESSSVKHTECEALLATKLLTIGTAQFSQSAQLIRWTAEGSSIPSCIAWFKLLGSMWPRLLRSARCGSVSRSRSMVVGRPVHLSLGLFLVSKNIQDLPSNRIFKHMHRVLNVDENKLITQFVCNLWDESFEPS